MSSLIKRLDVLEFSAPDTLMGFYEPRLKSFSVKPGSVGSEKRVCVTSTCYALLTLALCSGVYKQTTDSKQIPIRKVIKALLHSEWREDDIFQVPLLIYTILRVDTDRSLIRSAASNQDIASRIKRLLSAVLKASPQRRLGTRQLHSDYISYQVCKVAHLLHESSDLKKGTVSGLPANVLPDEVDSDIFWALLSCAEVSSNELCRQLAYRAAGDSNSFDVVRLAYSLLTYIKSTDSLSGIAGSELVAGQGPSPETKVPQLNQRLVTAALAAYFQEQNDNGLWDKGQPIYKSFAGGQGRNFENAFVFPVNTVGSLLCALPAEDFRSHLGALETTLAWIESHERLEVITNYCDPDSGECYGKPLRGWSSPHLSPDEGPQAWPTAQVLKCVSWMKKTISQLMHNDVLEEFNGIAFSNKGTRSAGWERLLDTDIGNPNNEEGCRTIKNVLEERVIKPFATSIDNPSYGAAYSAILFGPPGGAKTTICEALAQTMGYDFVVIDTATFLADGLTNVAARIRYVFTRLMALEKCVILFDVRNDGDLAIICVDPIPPCVSERSRSLLFSSTTLISPCLVCFHSRRLKNLSWTAKIQDSPWNLEC
jgi:hypothetical protein